MEELYLYQWATNGFFAITEKEANDRFGVTAHRRLICSIPEALAARKMRETLALAESVYRKNCVAEGEPSSVLAAMQEALAACEPD